VTFKFRRLGAFPIRRCHWLCTTELAGKLTMGMELLLGFVDRVEAVALAQEINGVLNNSVRKNENMRLNRDCPQQDDQDGNWNPER